MSPSYQSILERFDRGSRSYFLFETLVLKLLAEHLGKSGKTLQPGELFYEEQRRYEIGSSGTLVAGFEL